MEAFYAMEIGSFADIFFTPHLAAIGTLRDFCGVVFRCVPQSPTARISSSARAAALGCRPVREQTATPGDAQS
jgi:hypothetical protein